MSVSEIRLPLGVAVKLDGGELILGAAPIRCAAGMGHKGCHNVTGAGK
ncbi:MAG: hypothetical protein ACTHLX_23145 [Candidatus Binatia bacterium]